MNVLRSSTRPVDVRGRRFRPCLETLEERTVLSATYASVVLADAPVAYYRLGDASGSTTAVDSSGNGNNATYSGAVALGQAGSSLIVDDSTSGAQFNGGFVNLPAAPFGNYPTSGSTNNFTLSFEVWFNTTSGGTILGQNGSGSVPALYVDTSGLVRASMFWHNGVGVQIVSTNKYNDGNTHYLVDTYTNGTETLYIDNQKIGSQNAPEVSYSATYNYYLGFNVNSGWPNNTSTNYSGTLADAAVYQTALTAAQIQNHYSAGIANDVAFSATNYSVREDAGTALITLTRANNLTHSDTVTFTTSDGTAVAGTDYTAVSTTATFAAGQATTTVQVPIINRPGIQPSRTVNLSLSSSGGVGSAVVFGTTTAVLTITDTSTTTAVTSSLNPAEAGSLVTFTATITGGNTAQHAGETVTFLDNGTAIGTGTLDAAGQATFSTAVLVTGTHAITASYAGDANSDASVSPVLSQVIGTLPLIVSTDSGPVTEVKLLDPVTHAVLLDLLPFGPSFRGGARAALADLNGDGVLDLIVGAGPGGGPEVNVYNAQTGQLLETFFAFTPVEALGTGMAGPSNTTSPSNRTFAFTGGVYVATGDLNGTGLPDIIIGAGAGGGPQVQVYSGQSFSLLANFYAFGVPSFTGGVRVAAGDLSGTGHDDIVCAAGPGGSPQVTVYDGRTMQALASFLAFNAPAFAGGLYVATGDLNGNGVDEILVGAGSGGGPMVGIYSGTAFNPLAMFFAYDPIFTGGVRVAARATTSSGAADIFTAPGPGGSPLVNVINNQSLATMALFYAADLSQTDGLFLG